MLTTGAEMKSSESKMQEAESFVRKALSHFPDVVIDEDTIKSTALKVSESLPIMEKNVEKHQILDMLDTVAKRAVKRFENYTDRDQMYAEVGVQTMKDLMLEELEKQI